MVYFIIVDDRIDHDHVVFATALGTDRSCIFPMSPFLGLAKMFACSPGSPSEDFSLPGWRPAPSLPPCTPRQCVTTPKWFFRVDVLLLSDTSHCSCHYAAQGSAVLHRRGWDVDMKPLPECRLFAGWCRQRLCRWSVS